MSSWNKIFILIFKKYISIYDIYIYTSVCVKSNITGKMGNINQQRYTMSPPAATHMRPGAGRIHGDGEREGEREREIVR